MRASTKTRQREMNQEILNLLEVEREISPSITEKDNSVDSSKDLSDECSDNSD